MGGCFSRQHKVTSCPLQPTSPDISAPAELTEPQVRMALEESIQAEKARNAPSLELGRSALWLKRKSVLSLADEETRL